MHEKLTQTWIDCLAPSGMRIAVLHLMADGTISPTPLTMLDEIEAVRRGEPAVQLRESAHYEYTLESTHGLAGSLRLRCPLARRSLNCRDDEDRGQLDTSTYCGELRLEIIDSANEQVVAVARVEVRSVKLSYREDFRVMLRDVNTRLAGLIFDLRAPTQAPLMPAHDESLAQLQQQIAFLCERLESIDFVAALQQVLAQPQRQLLPQVRRQSIQQPMKLTRALAQQLVRGVERVALPELHPLAQRLRARGHTCPSLPTSVVAHSVVDDLDTVENRFVKHALLAWVRFLEKAVRRLRQAGADWAVVAQRAEHTALMLKRWLNHAMFDRIAPMQHLPTRSPVLQRRPGYRTLLQTWLNFQASAQLNWVASDDLFRAGQRNVASLYEYWVFFQLLDWFCGRFDCRLDAAHQLLQPSKDGLMLNLRHGFSVAVMAGTIAINAQLRYNQTFVAAATIDGSWTRTMRPDITLSFWPGTMTIGQAATDKRLVHLHFDAKYRVATLSDALGESVAVGGTHREDLIKMHAYRDAIRHTQGAYVIYPGSAADLAAQSVGRPNLMFATSALLPSLGAFALVPSAEGAAKGIITMTAFLDAVLRTFVDDRRDAQ